MFAPKSQSRKPNSTNHSSVNSFIQPKLNVGKPGDKYEVEADKAADQIVAGRKDNPSSFLAPTVQKKNEEEVQKKESNDSEIQQKPLVDKISPGVQLKPESTVQKQEEDVQQKEDDEIQKQEEDGIQQVQMSGGDDNSSLESDLNSSKGGGNALPKDTQNEMESGFGADFSGVRVHNDNNAVQMNQELGSQAFTNGNDIYFNEGKYDPESDSGKHLLAHELTHTVQQGASPSNTVQKSEGDVENTTLVAPTQPQDITNGFQLSDDWLAYIEQESRTRDFDVAVKIGERFSGTIKIRKLGRPAEGETQKFELSSSRRNNHLDVRGMEFLNPLREAGVHPILVLNSFGEEQNTTGFLSIRTGETVVPNVLGIIQGINENLEAMSFLGLSPIEVAEGLENRFENGGLNFRANNLSANVDGYIEASGSLGITDSTMTFELNSTVDIAGLAEGEFNVSRGADGKLSGQATIAADIANVSASLTVEYDDGAVTIQGTGRMNSDKFSGEITLLVTDAARSTQMMHAALGVESMEQEAEAPPQDQAAVPKTKNNQVLAGWGEVQATITPWLEGTAKIGIDNEGHVTIVGEIVVPDEIELMEQRGKKVDIFQVEIRAGYGIPLVGQVFLFASIGMFANAGFGPLVLKNVGFTGTYSTDPNVLQEFSITGTLGINAFAVLGLEAEAGVGVTLLGHDVKAGVNVTAAAGLRAYAEATPTFEYKEEQAPEGGKVGESRLKGHFEAAAQLFLQLSGALFYELDSPWWSPAPDGREEYPLGEVQYPIGDSLGIGADVDWLVGGEEPPELTFSPVEFDPDKFTADVMADPPPRSMGDSESNPAGEWQGENAPGDQNENPEITGEGEGLPPGRREEDLSNLPDEQKYMRALDDLSQMENANPKPTIGDVEDKISTVKRRYGIRKIETRNEEAERVAIFVQHADQDNGRHLLEIALMSASEKQRLIDTAKEELQSNSRRAADEEGKITRGQAEDVLSSVENSHDVILEARIVEGENTWDYFISFGDRNQDTETGNSKLEAGDEENIVEEGAENELENIIGLTAPVNVDGGHNLKLEGSIQRVEKNVYSEKKSLVTLIRDKEAEIDENGALDPDFEDKKTSIQSLKSETSLLESNISEYRSAVDNAYQQGHGNTPVKTAYDNIQTNLTNIAADLVVVGILPDDFDMPVSHVDHTLEDGKAKTLTAEPISQIPGNTRGSTPTQDPLGWTDIPVALRSSGAWVRAHLLNHRLHGPGVRWNLFPGTRKMNLDDMEKQVESKGKEAVWDEGKVIYYHVTLTYGNEGDFEEIPTQVHMKVGEYDLEAQAPDTSKTIVEKTFTQSPPDEIQELNFNESSASALKKAARDNNISGLQGQFFTKLVEGRESITYKNPNDIRKTVKLLYSDENAFDTAFSSLRDLIEEVTIKY
ncbi:DUF4157 domain-containing protein [Tenacibaculum sp. 190524A05c]|uniref:eCIS core domain-containing protein n=1 Tax=Tenacibaculum platacis TaxID=3137852 RepID=A0ABM9NX92_9FLAO